MVYQGVKRVKLANGTTKTILESDLKAAGITRGDYQSMRAKGEVSESLENKILKAASDRTEVNFKGAKDESVPANPSGNKELSKADRLKGEKKRELDRDTRSLSIPAKNFLETKSLHHEVAYLSDGKPKIVSMDYASKDSDLYRGKLKKKAGNKEFRLGASRIIDNGSPEGLVKAPRGDFYLVSRGSRSAKPVSKDVAQSVLSKWFS